MAQRKQNHSEHSVPQERFLPQPPLPGPLCILGHSHSEQIKQHFPKCARLLLASVLCLC